MSIAMVLGVVLGGAASASAKTPWIMNAAQAKKAIDGGAAILDTRSGASFTLGHPQGARRVTWQEFSRGKGPKHGTLLPAKKVGEKLRAHGVDRDEVVLVVGDPKGGWGEEGRIVWMLRTMGHKHAAWVDGGWSALSAAGVPTARGASASVEPGDFVPRRPKTWSVDKDGVKGEISDAESVIVDTREAREFAGKTPYGESRGGHVPSAVHLHFKDFIGSDGKLLPKPVLEKKLAGLGIERDTEVVAYCTGGIRSAWFVTVLVHLGYRGAKNYAGSMWEWSAASSADYPLE